MKTNIVKKIIIHIKCMNERLKHYCLITIKMYCCIAVEILHERNKGITNDINRNISRCSNFVFLVVKTRYFIVFIVPGVEIHYM